MGVVDDLLRAREDYERGDWAAALDTWSGVAPDDMSADDLDSAAKAAFLAGRRDASVDLHQRAFHLREAADDPAGAIRNAFHVAMVHGAGGEPALAAGWTTRAEHLLEGLGTDVVEHGYVAFLHG